MTTSANGSHKRLPRAEHDQSETASATHGGFQKARDIEFVVLSSPQTDPLVQHLLSSVHNVVGKIVRGLR